MQITDILFIIIFWICWYGSMFLIGYFLESRVVPLGKHQSRSYFPGNMVLPIMMVGIYREYERTDLTFPGWVLTPIFTIAVAIICFVIASLWLKKDHQRYSPRALASPTKRWYDTVAYFICFPLIVEGALPLVIGVVSGGFVPTTRGFALFLYSIAFIAVMFSLDDLYPANASDLNARHPENWCRRKRRI